jgi:hypothetical protein
MDLTNMFVNSDILERFLHCGKTLAKQDLLPTTDNIFLTKVAEKSFRKSLEKTAHIFYSNTFSSISLMVFKRDVSKLAPL